MLPNGLTALYDAVIVGSGATGGWAAKRLAEAGLKVALLDAGPPVSPAEFTEHVPAFRLKYRNLSPEIARRRPVQTQCYACMEYNYKWFVDDLENPYSTPEGRPFSWQRLRVVGGRSLVWGRQSYRLSQTDFKGFSHDGYDTDWPIGYQDLSPYYDIVERYVGISGAAENHAMLPDSQFLPPMAMYCPEVRLRDVAGKKFGRTVTMGRVAMLTVNHNGRAACHYCGPCERGCQTFSYFSSPFTTVKDALKTGNCTLIPNAVVSHVDMLDGENKARGVTYLDRVTHQSYQIRARSVILCAQALESTRILLNSSTKVYTNGLANSSGVLGHYLMDHASAMAASGDFPDFHMQPTMNGPHRPNGVYVIRFRNLPNGPRDGRFIRGYGLQGGSGTGFSFGAPGYGPGYKRAVKDGVFNTNLWYYGESLARRENFCEIDRNLRDAWGIPALRISMAHGGNERAMLQDASVAAAEMLDAAGAKNIKTGSELDMPGMAIHEVGTARMGRDRETSVLNAWNQAHDVPNLLVMDGACFVSSACQNPTLTMMAIAVRASDHLIERFKRNEV